MTGSGSREEKDREKQDSGTPPAEEEGREGKGKTESADAPAEKSGEKGKGSGEAGEDSGEKKSPEGKEPPSKDAKAADKKPPEKGKEPGEKPPEESGPPHPYEGIMDEYPLRDAGEDPVWSVRIVKGWMWFLAFSVGGIILLLVLGIWYD